MKATGIVRRVDDLGRIAIPKLVRKEIGISEGTAMELFTEKDTVIFKKYYVENSLSDLARSLSDAVDDVSTEMEPEKAAAIKQRIREIQKLLNLQN